MWKRFFVVTGVALLLGACEDEDTVLFPIDDFPAAQWNGEAFHVVSSDRGGDELCRRGL
jgi:hypothetical protein